MRARFSFSISILSGQRTLKMSILNFISTMMEKSCYDFNVELAWVINKSQRQKLSHWRHKHQLMSGKTYKASPNLRNHIMNTIVNIEIDRYSISFQMIIQLKTGSNVRAATAALKKDKRLRIRKILQTKLQIHQKRKNC